MRLVITLIFLFLFNISSVYAKDCNVEIKASEGTNKLNSILKCLNDEINELKAMKGGDRKFPSVVDKSLFSAEKKAKMNKKLTYSFPKCLRSEGDVQCEIIIRNKYDYENTFRMWVSGSIAFSDRMTQDEFYDVKVANELHESRGTRIDFVIPGKVTIPLNFVIRGTPEKSQFYQNITLKMDNGNVLRFNNIPIE